MSLREAWQRFSKVPVGQRFQARYHNNHSKGARWLMKSLTLLAGGLVLMAGLLMMIAPGPGFLAFFLGAILLGQESLWMSRLLDACDLRGRRLLRALHSGWKRAHMWQKILIVLGVLVVLIALLGLGAWTGLQIL